MSSAPEISLEKALSLAVAEPAQRPEFYRTLLSATVYCLGHTAQAQAGPATLEAGAEVLIEHGHTPEGAPMVPFFTSLATLQRSIAAQTRYLALPARTFFQLTQGSTLCLDPGLAHSKTFTPDEVTALLRHGLPQLPARRVLARATEVRLGTPARVPARMVAALSALLARHGNVRAAYLALLHEAASGEAPRLVVGIEAEGNADQVVREAGVVAADTAPEGEAVELYRVCVQEGGLSGYLVQTVKPFYQRSWVRSLKAFLGLARGREPGA